MMSNHKLLVVLTASTLLVTGAALAANQEASTQPSHQPRQNAVDGAFRKLSADGARAYQYITLTRLAIFSGRIDEAKMSIGEADAGFAKAKGDESVFTKAEADLKAPQNGTKAAQNDVARPEHSASRDSAKTPIAWLPVDGTVSINDDYSLNPAKTAAVSDANKSLKAGDNQGAMAKLKLANVNVSVTLAVVPLNQTVNDVHQAAGLINDGKYYEASQLLRQAQDGERFDIASASENPQAASTVAPKTEQATPAATKSAPQPAK